MFRKAIGEIRDGQNKNRRFTEINTISLRQKHNGNDKGKDEKGTFL